MSATCGEFKRHFFIVAGTIAIGIGVIGIFVPLLPTTPFLILAAICYGRGSKRLYNMLLSNRIVGNYLKNYLESKAMSAKAKILTLSMLWIAIGCTAALLTDSQLVRIVLFAVGSGVTVHIVLLRVSVTSRPVFTSNQLPGENKRIQPTDQNILSSSNDSV
ncbi:YbaN family protein [Chloroflexota bacterium]